MHDVLQVQYMCVTLTYYVGFILFLWCLISKLANKCLCHADQTYYRRKLCVISIQTILYVLCCYHIQHCFCNGTSCCCHLISSMQQQSKPIGFPKALLYHMMEQAHNRLSNLVSATMQSFPALEQPALVCHGWKYTVWYSFYHKLNIKIVKFTR